MLTTIPFSGFYNTLWELLIDSEIESLVEGGEDMDSLYAACDFRKAHLAIAQDYVEALEKVLGLGLGLKFESLDSPREYNYVTDRIFCELPLSAVMKLWEHSATLDSHESLKRVIRDRFTHRDGFASSYSPNWPDWQDKPLADWDHNEVGTLLQVAVDALGEGWDLNIYYTLSDHAYTYIDAART